MPEKIEQFCQRHEAAARRHARRVRPHAASKSLALTYRKTLEGLEDVLGRRINAIHIVGGGSQNELLNQMTADACEREVIAGPVEATAIGNILVQAMATGDIKSLADARAIVAQQLRREDATSRSSPSRGTTRTRGTGNVGKRDARRMITGTEAPRHAWSNVRP